MVSGAELRGYFSNKKNMLLVGQLFRHQLQSNTAKVGTMSSGPGARGPNRIFRNTYYPLPFPVTAGHQFS